MKRAFCHLHCHSNFSMLRGACTVDELAAAAKARGFRALAITDTNGLYGAVEFYRACAQHGIKAIFGAEIDSPAEDPAAERAVFLARTREGYSELCRIITERHLADDFDLAAAIAGASAHIIVLTGCRSLVERVGRTPGRRNGGHRRARLYFELQPAETPAERRTRDDAARWAQQNLVPVVAAADVHFINPDQHKVHQVLRAIDLNTSVAALRPGEFAPASCWLKPADRVAREMGPWETALANAAAIAAECNVELELGRMRFPEFDVPNGRTAADYLRELAYRGAEAKYGTLASVVRSRVDYELETIIDMGFADYFLIVWDIAEEAKRRGIPIVGRGSAADSIIAYVLDLTRVDPVEHNLYFERFLNRQRKDPPDIDLDFCWRRRDEIIEYVFDKYGRDRVAMICTHNTFGTRSAIRDVARAMGLSPAEISRIVARLPRGSVRNIEQAVATQPEYAGLPIDKDPLKSILEIARAIDGYPRHLSVHAGGLVIAPDRITNYTPLQYAAKGVVITQCDMHPIEDLGLVKMDLLGQRSLSVIADTVEAVRQRYGTLVDIEAIPLDDEPMKELLRRGATVGCFQIESPGMRQLLQKLRADNFEIITAASSVIRPGPADSGMMASFIRRHLGKEPPTYTHPKLEPLLKETYGVMLYQEDVLRVASAIGGMSLGEADDLRRSMTKKRGYEGIADAKDRFLRGAREKGIPADAAHEIWRQIESFSGYAFCKAHSASYARLSMQAAYLKAHYPAEFMAAVLANGGGFYSAWAYVEEARRMGLTILPPDVNRAGRTFQAENDAELPASQAPGRAETREGIQPRPAKGAVRVGLEQVKSLTRRTINAIIERRAERPFDSVADFIARVPISLKECENLIQCGAMDEFDANRPRNVWLLNEMFDAVRRHKTAAAAHPLFAGREQEAVAIPHVPDYSLAQRLEFERRVLDFCVTAHPMTVYLDRYESGEWTPVARAAEFVGRRITVAGWPITAKGTATNTGQRMRFVSIEDHTGVLEVVFFPDVYRRCARQLHKAPLVVTGRVTADEGVPTLEADSAGGA